MDEDETRVYAAVMARAHHAGTDLELLRLLIDRVVRLEFALTRMEARIRALTE